MVEKIKGKLYQRIEELEDKVVKKNYFISKIIGETKQLKNTCFFIEKKGEGIHHIAFEVTDIHAEMKRLQQEGFILLSEEPQKGADNKLICFLHPKSSNGVLIELCQELK